MCYEHDQEDGESGGDGYLPLMSYEHDQEDGEGEGDVVDGVQPLGEDQSIGLALHAQWPVEN